MKKKVLKKKVIRKAAKKSVAKTISKKKTNWSWAHRALHAGIFATAASAIRAALR